MSSHYTESDYEKSLIELFVGMGYTHVYGPEVKRDYTSPLYDEVLEESVRRLNPKLPEEALTAALKKVREFELASLEQKNAVFTDYLQNGVEVSYRHKGETRAALVYLADYDKPANNSFIVANQWTFVELSTKRPDILLFLNGIPVVLVELKSPSRKETDASEAFLQMRNYMQEIPAMFCYNAICVMSDMGTSKAGTITSGEDRYMEWKTRDGSYENTQYAQFDTFFEGMFTPERLLDILQNFICFAEDGSKQIKILAAYHQYFAVRRAVESSAAATKRDGRAGVFWHTQGSGKSLSMVFYAHLLQERLQSPTIVVLTDRNDLDNQLFLQFSKCRRFLRQTPVQARDREHLVELLEGRQANGIFFTTMQKFTEGDSPLSERRNIVVMADEAHRSQYGLREHFRMVTNEAGETEAKRVVGAARLVRKALPNATFIGFTGTPVSTRDRNTEEVFGHTIDVYDMTQAVEDGATRPVYYESRVVKLGLDEETLKLIDTEYELMEKDATPEVVQRSKLMLGQMEAVLGNPNTIDSLVKDIVAHYEGNRAHLLTGKAMIVAYSREIALKIYARLLELRPAWQEKVAVVMTDSNKDPEDWRRIIGNKAHREELAVKFKDDDSPLKIAIVVDMWLTGFDVPSLATMYVYKPMAGHNLMQAIARVNRVFRDKEGGLVIDYVGIAAALKKAMAEYSARDRKNYGNPDVARVAYPKFLEKLQVCRDLLHGCTYELFFTGTDLQRGRCITEAVNFLLSPAKKEEQELFMRASQMMRQSLSLCSSLAQERERMEAAFMEAVRTLLSRLTNSGGGRHISLREMNSRINELLKQSIKSDGVMNLFADAKSDFSLFDPKFLDEIAKLKTKNIALELLRRLILEQVQLYRRTNVVKSEKFSDIIRCVMNRYLNGLITNEQVIAELLKLAEQIRQAHQAGQANGLTEEELAFYDALTKPEVIKDFYTNDVLVSMTRELTDTLRRSRTVDWQRRSDARAKMRVMIRKLLRKYHYPPEGMDDAIKTVMTQCELWADNLEFDTYATPTAQEYTLPENEEDGIAAE